jgi:hypothetical protein
MPRIVGRTADGPSMNQYGSISSRSRVSGAVSPRAPNGAVSYLCELHSLNSGMKTALLHHEGRKKRRASVTSVNDTSMTSLRAFVVKNTVAKTNPIPSSMITRRVEIGPPSRYCLADKDTNLRHVSRQLGSDTPDQDDVGAAPRFRPARKRSGLPRLYRSS